MYTYLNIKQSRFQYHMNGLLFVVAKTPTPALLHNSLTGKVTYPYSFPRGAGAAQRAILSAARMCI